jgi:hypothetical protein
MYRAPEHYPLTTAVVPTFMLLLLALLVVIGVRMPFLYIYEKFTFPLKRVFLHTSLSLFCAENFVFIEGSAKKDIQCAIGCNCWDMRVVFPQTLYCSDALKVGKL